MGYKIPNFKKNTVSTTFTDKDSIPYKLSGSDVLHKQGYLGAGVKIAVLDTGADLNHPLLKDRIKETNHKTVAYLTNAMDEEGHGTHVCGTYAINSPQSEIIPWKVIAPYGGDFEWLAQALNEVADRDDIDVVNMSLSGKMIKGSTEYNLVYQSILRCVQKNIFIVVASGNTGAETELYPACFEEVTTVGAVDINKKEALFSTLSNHVDMCQVGVDLVSANLGGGYCALSGTSMATPMVGSLAALLIGKHKEMFGKRPSGSELHRMLKLFSLDLGIKGTDSKTGSGFISLNPSASIISMTIGSTMVKYNGIPQTMELAPFITSNRTVVPVRYANLGKLVLWDSITKEVTVVG